MSTTATEINPKPAPAEVKPGVRYVIDNTKYPDYIRQHNVFHKQRKITKVFPSIGLPNTSEDCEYSCINDARSDATNLLYTDIRNGVYSGLLLGGVPTEFRNVLEAVYRLLNSQYTSMIAVEDGRIALKFHADCGTYEGKPFVRKGEGVFKAYGKLSEKLKELVHTELPPLDRMTYFKNFSSTNIPSGKKFKVVFSSIGEDGLWDIATISMRGIQSCQSWNTPQSRGLIGSMSSKYVGVMYITSGDKYNEYGSKMLRRAMVRFCINSKTKKPGLLVDRVYPADDAATRDIFRKFLTSKTNLPVMFPGEGQWNDYQLPTDATAWKLAPFQANEYTYMDTKIPWLQSATQVKDTQSYFNAIAVMDNNLTVKLHDKILKELDEYCVDHKAHSEVFKGGVANLLVSLKKHVGGHFAASAVMPKLYSQLTTTTAFPQPDKYETVQDYQKAVIRQAFIKMQYLEEVSRNRVRSFGKFSKFYPKSVDKYHAYFMSEYKKELMEQYKNLLRL